MKPPVAPLVSPSTVSTTLEPPLRVRRASDPGPLPPVLAALAESRAGVAKAWLVRAIEAAPLDQVESLPVGRIASDLPALVADLVRAAAGAIPRPASAPRWLDRLGCAARRRCPARRVVRDLGMLHEAMLSSLERQAAALDASELIARRGAPRVAVRRPPGRRRRAHGPRGRRRSTSYSPAPTG